MRDTSRRGAALGMAGPRQCVFLVAHGWLDLGFATAQVISKPLRVQRGTGHIRSQRLQLFQAGVKIRGGCQHMAVFRQSLAVSVLRLLKRIKAKLACIRAEGHSFDLRLQRTNRAKDLRRDLRLCAELSHRQALKYNVTSASKCRRVGRAFLGHDQLIRHLAFGAHVCPDHIFLLVNFLATRVNTANVRNLALAQSNRKVHRIGIFGVDILWPALAAGRPLSDLLLKPRGPNDTTRHPAATP